MKRIWFAIIFLAMAASLCITEQVYISRFHTDMEKKITAASAAAESQSPQALQSALEDIKTYWNNRNEALCMLTNHMAPDEIGTAVRAAEADNPHIEEELARLRALNEIFYENQHITFANIF